MADGEDAPQGRAHGRGSEDAEQAQWLSEALGQGIRYDHTAKRWHIWNGVRWAPDLTKEVQRRCLDLVYERVNEVARQYAVGELRDEKFKHQMKVYRRLLERGRLESALEVLSWIPGYKTDGADWDQNPNLLGCENGIVDLTKNELVPNPGPELLVTRTTGHRFIPFKPQETLFDAIETHLRSLGHREPRFPSFLREITSGDDKLAAFFLLWFGYSLFGHTQEQRFLILTGLGRNGKGALVTAMRFCFGEYSAKADSSLYMRSRFGSARSDQARADLMELKGRRLAVMSEPDGGVFNEEMLKAHTGGDPITARALHSNNVITWLPTHSITFLTNQPPSVNDIGPAMAARVMVADFRERFDGEKEDKKLYGKLEAEAEGILGVLCWSAKVWYESDGGLALPDRVRRASQEYLDQNDPIGRVLGDAFVVERGAKTAARELYDAYLDWHARSDDGGDALSQTAFGLALAKRGFQKSVTRGGRVWMGLRPKSAVELADEA